MQQKKVIEIDARPSDCIAMATAEHVPIYVSLEVWDEVEGMTEALRMIQEEGSQGGRKRRAREFVGNGGVDETSPFFLGLLGSPLAKSNQASGGRSRRSAHKLWSGLR